MVAILEASSLLLEQANITRLTGQWIERRLVGERELSESSGADIWFRDETMIMILAPLNLLQLKHQARGSVIVN